MFEGFPSKRPRRNRKSLAIRNLVRENRLHAHDFIAPFFIIEGQGVRQPIHSLPGIYRLSIDQLVLEATQLLELGIQATILFPYIETSKRDLCGAEALLKDTLMQRAIKTLKQELPKLCVISDVALDPYTTHGHDGIMNPKNEIDNDLTLEVLAKMAIAQAEAGIDIVAPSDMMDGRINYIRQALDYAGFNDVSIMAYAVKYASALYAPFRDALGTILLGDKKTYQMDPANTREALVELTLDEAEGADFLMVKPALFYLDIIAKARLLSPLPIVAYQVSGEYAMIHSAAERGWIDSRQVMLEALLAIKRAGADMIITYAAKEIVPLLSNYQG